MKITNDLDYKNGTVTLFKQINLKPTEVVQFIDEVELHIGLPNTKIQKDMSLLQKIASHLIAEQSYKGAFKDEK